MIEIAGAKLVVNGSPWEYKKFDGPELRNDGKEPTSPWTYPLRGYAAFGTGRGYVVLPDVGPIRTYHNGINRIWDELGVTTQRLQTIWVEDPLKDQRDTLDQVILDDMSSFAVQIKDRNSPYTIVCHANTPELRAWQEQLKTDYGVNTQVIMDPKPYKYPNPFDRSGFAAFADKYGLPIPFTQVGVERAEMDTAYGKVVENSGDQKVWVKWAVTGGGYSVIPVKSLEQAHEAYDKFDKLGILHLYEGRKIPWEMQANIKDIVAYYSFQHQGNRVTTPGDYCLQYMDPEDPSSWVGNAYNLRSDNFLPQEERKIAMELQRSAMRAFAIEYPNHNYMGGLDFVIAGGEQTRKGLFLENNGARMSDAVLQSEAARVFGIGKRGEPFLAIKLGKPKVDIADFWQFLKGNGLAYDGNQGVVPFAWIKDNKVGYATAIMTAPDPNRLYTRVVEKMKLGGVIE